MPLSKDIVRGMRASGVRPLSDAQRRIIGPILDGRDCTAEVRPGISEVIAVLGCVLQSIDASVHRTQVLIIPPTRELAQQISKLVIGIGRYLGIICNYCVPTNPVPADVQRLSQGPHVVVGTHARVLDMIHQGALDISHVTVFCLTNADTTLAKSRGFVIELLLSLRSTCQFIMLSPDLSPAVVEATRWYMRKPARIELQTDEPQIRDIRQYYIAGEQENWKFEALRELCNNDIITHAIVFCATPTRAKLLCKRLAQQGLRVLSIRTPAEYKKRETSIKEFKYGGSGLIVATDLLAIMLDELQIPVVINYDMPDTVEAYIKRVDDGGQCGTKRAAISLIRRQDAQLLQEIQRSCDTVLEPLPDDFQAPKVKEKGKVSLVEWRRSRQD